MATRSLLEEPLVAWPTEKLRRLIAVIETGVGIEDAPVLRAVRLILAARGGALMSTRGPLKKTKPKRELTEEEEERASRRAIYCRLRKLYPNFTGMAQPVAKKL